MPVRASALTVARPPEQHGVFDKIVELARGGLTVMLVEQNAARVLEISDRGYVLELGRNRFEGTGHELLENPTSGGCTSAVRVAWRTSRPAAARRVS